MQVLVDFEAEVQTTERTEVIPLLDWQDGRFLSTREVPVNPGGYATREDTPPRP
jgi:hypothetical protein